MARIPRSPGMCDIHCHILPGIDDGPATVKESIEMCRQAAADGIRTIVAAPHYNGVYRPDARSISQAADQLTEALAAEQLPLAIELGAEVAPQADLAGLVECNPHLTIGWQQKYVLLEPPIHDLPEWFTEMIFELRIRGLGVIISHVERNADVQEDPAIILPLVQSGVMLQLTADSIVGNLGREAKRCAAALLKMNAVHFIATDAHSPGFRSPHLYDAVRRAARYIGERALALVCDNPMAVLSGGLIDVPDPQPPRSWFGWIAAAQ